MNLLTASNLSRRDHGKLRLSNINLNLQQGEVVGILGINGAGKSTTLALLSGALSASSGRINILGQPLNRKNRVHIGLLPETPPLYPELTVNENLDFAGRLRGLGKSQLATARQQIKSSCGLDKHGNKLARQLSKGYRLRVGIAQAIIHQPQVLLLDEPTAGLDPLQAREIRKLIAAISPQTGIIMATHDMGDIQQLCHRVVVLDAGVQVLEQDLRSLQHGFRLQLQSPPPLAALQTLDGVNNAQRLHDDWFHLILEQASAEQLADQIVAQGWGLQALIPEQNQIEALIFSMMDFQQS